MCDLLHGVRGLCCVACCRGVYVWCASGVVRCDACALTFYSGHTRHHLKLAFKTQSQVARITNGQGVDLILDCIGASYFEQNVESIKMDGAWVLYGTLGGTQPEGPVLRMLMKKRVQLRCTTLR